MFPSVSQRNNRVIRKESRGEAVDAESRGAEGGFEDEDEAYFAAVVFAEADAGKVFRKETKEISLEIPCAAQMQFSFRIDVGMMN